MQTRPLILAAIALTTATTNGAMQTRSASARCTDAPMRALDFWERYTGLPGELRAKLTWDVIEKGKRIPKRYTLSGSQSGQPRRVRQLGERSDDGGNTWTIEFDLRYVPASGG